MLAGNHSLVSYVWIVNIRILLYVREKYQLFLNNDRLVSQEAFLTVSGKSFNFLLNGSLVSLVHT